MCLFEIVGTGVGAAFSLMGTTFSYEAAYGTHTQQTTKAWFRDQGQKMWRTGRSFGKVGALYSGTECVIESVSRVSVGICQEHLLTPNGPSVLSIFHVCSIARKTTFITQSRQVSSLERFLPGIRVRLPRWGVGWPLHYSQRGSSFSCTGRRSESNRPFHPAVW